jgi:uncharacterized protein (DUF1778 family)
MATNGNGKRTNRAKADPVDKPTPTSIRLSRAERKVIGRAAVEVEESRQEFIVNATMSRVKQVLGARVTLPAGRADD